MVVNIEDKEGDREVVVDYNDSETSMHAIFQEDVNTLLVDRYEVENDGLPASNNIPSARGDTDRPVYKELQTRNVIDYNCSSGCQLDSAKRDRTDR